MLSIKNRKHIRQLGFLLALALAFYTVFENHHQSTPSTSTSLTKKSQSDPDPDPAPVVPAPAPAAPAQAAPSPAPQRIFRLYVPHRGRLGNQLYSMACVYGLARTNNRRLVLPPRLIQSVSGFLNVSVLRKEFKISNPPYNVLQKKLRYAFYQPQMEHLHETRDILLRDYLQVAQYFLPYEHEVRKLFVITTNLVCQAQHYLLALNTSHDSTFVGIHVRGTDMNNVTLGRMVPSPEYLRGAMSHFLRMYRNVHFIVCTEDQQQCKHNQTYLQPGKLSHIAKYKVHYSTLSSAEQDLALLAQCNHTIMTVGTFGWWGAWLAGGDTIYFNESIAKRSRFYKDFRNSDFFWPSWIGMNDKVK